MLKCPPVHRIAFPLLLISSALWVTACVRFPVVHGQGPTMKNAELVYPVIAVADFENRANFRGQWQLGNGFADLLVTRLLKREDVVVLERHNLSDVLGELDLQHSKAFRQEGQRNFGRLKNAEYILRGVITDFTVTSDLSGWFGTGEVGARGGKSKARVSMNIKVADVETGQIINSVESSGKASSGMFGAAVNYKSVAFGGEAFFRTPLGRATNDAMDKALVKILQSLPQKTWQPRVADVVGTTVIINGGLNVGLEAGTAFEVRGAGRDITDPVTGNVIQRLPGPAIGKVVVNRVLEQSAYGQVVSGQVNRGAILVEAALEGPR